MRVPYWRLDDGETGQPTAPLIWSRLRMAIPPLMAVFMTSARREVLVIAASQLGSGLATAGVFLLVTDLLSRILEATPIAMRVQAAVPALLVLLALYIGKLGFEAAVMRARARLVPKVKRAAEARLFEASLKVPLSTFDEAGFYDQLHRARDRGVMHVEGAAGSLVDAMSAFCIVLGAVVALGIIHPALLPLLLLALAPEGLAALWGARLQYAGMPKTISLSRRAAMMGEIATERGAAPEVRANQTQAYVLAVYGGHASALQDHLVALGLREADATILGRGCAAFGMVCTFAALVWMLHRGWIELAAAGAVVVAIRATAGALQQLMRMLNELFEKALYISDYGDFLETSRKASTISAVRPAPARPGCITLDAVTFSYPGSTRRFALREISLQIEAGQTIALVGENGSGKTTLAKLLAGLYSPTSGRVLWDGVDLREFDPDTVASRIAMVQQHPVRWPRSARENIRLGRHDRDDPAAILEAAGLARAAEIIERLPQGWDTLLSKELSNGEDLSTGQWQRLAIARGLYREAPIVIWDEPAAPLDARAEHAVYETLRRLARDHTTIMVTHRLSSIRDADQIFLLEQGRLVEQGGHDALMRAGGRYRSMFELQLEMQGMEDNAAMYAP